MLFPRLCLVDRSYELDRSYESLSELVRSSKFLTRADGTSSSTGIMASVLKAKLRSITPSRTLESSDIPRACDEAQWLTTPWPCPTFFLSLGGGSDL